MYADFTYYQTEYGGNVLKSADDFKRYERKAERRIDAMMAYEQLQFAFPSKKRDIEKVMDCVCEMTEFLFRLDQYINMAMDSVGTVTQADGTVKGKFVTSMASGSESIGYSTNGGFTKTDIEESAGDIRKREEKESDIFRRGLSNVHDYNGMVFGYRGIPYPYGTDVVNPPPEDKVEVPEEEQPTEPQTQSENSDIPQNESQDDDTELYVDSVIVYNHYQTSGVLGVQQYFGSRFDNVRIELTQGLNITKSGSTDVSSCILKIRKTDPVTGKPIKPYQPPEVWKKLTTEEMLENFTLNKGSDFFLIVKKEELGIDIDAPVGLVESDDPKYKGGFFEYTKTKWGYAFAVDTVDVYTLIPRFEVGGK